MKKLAIVSLSVFFVLNFIQLPAQDVKKETIKSEIKEAKKEIKTERKELRKLEGSAVSEISKKNFQLDFGNVANVQWKRSNFFDEAVFTQDGKQGKAYYDYGSKLVGIIYDKTFADLPAKAQKEIKTKYSDYTVGQVTFFDDNDLNDTDMYLWNKQFDDTDNYFVVLSKDTKYIVLKISPAGDVSFFKQL